MTAPGDPWPYQWTWPPVPMPMPMEGFWPIGERAMHCFPTRDGIEWHRGTRTDCWLCQVRDNQDKPAGAQGEK